MKTLILPLKRTGKAHAVFSCVCCYHFLIKYCQIFVAVITVYKECYQVVINMTILDLLAI